MDVVVEVPWHGIRAYQLPMGVRGAVSIASVACLRSLLLCTKLAHLSHEQCAAQTRRESSARSAAGVHYFNAAITVISIQGSSQTFQFTCKDHNSCTTGAR